MNSAMVVVVVKGNVLRAVSGVCNVMKCDGGEGRVCRGGIYVCPFVRAAAEIVMIAAGMMLNREVRDATRCADKKNKKKSGGEMEIEWGG